MYLMLHPSLTSLLMPCRQTLLEVALAGPAAGALASLIFLLVGLGLSAAGSGGIEVQTSAFQDSLLIEVLGELGTPNNPLQRPLLLLLHHAMF